MLPPAYKSLLDSRQFVRGTFVIRARMDAYSAQAMSEENKIRYNISKFMERDYQSENKALLSRLVAYEGKSK